MENHQKILAITSGEPAGVGPDLCRHLLSWEIPARCVILGDLHLIAERSQIPCVPFKPHKPAPTKPLEVFNIPLRARAKAGVLNVKNAPYVLELLDAAIAGAQQGDFSAVVTLPIQKSVIADSGIAFTGHTEYFATKTQTPKPVMMLLGEQLNGAGILRVALATTHLPLKDVAAAITKESLFQVLAILLKDLREKYGIPNPKIAVTGLNPHAGESGHLGDEELTTILPVIQQFQALGEAVDGAFPADTLFTPRNLQGFDAVLAMYHDQGLAPLKYATFGNGANVTLGLPIIRTSVDHGTALDLAGTQKANPQSFKVAIFEALKMAAHFKR